jgi:hypothetical protein
MTVQFTGGPGAEYLIQATSSLAPADWVTIGSGTANDDGSVSFSDPDAKFYQVRFYRAAKP